MSTEPEFVDPSAARWWEYPLTSAMTGIIGGGIWLGHAWYAGRLVRDPGWRGDRERPARLRMAYFVAVILATAAGTLYQLGEGVGAAISAVAGAATQGARPRRSSCPSSAPFRSRSRGGSTSARCAQRRSRAATRIGSTPKHGSSCIRWRSSASGSRPSARHGSSARSSTRSSEVAACSAAVTSSETRSPGTRRSRYSASSSGSGHGAGHGTRRGRSDGRAASTTRRATLLIVLAVSVIAGVIAAAVMLYRLFGSVFGVEQGGNPISELSLPIGILLVASVVAAYHATQLRRTSRCASRPRRLSRRRRRPRSVELRLSGPADGDLAAVVAGLRAQLPPGFELDGAPPPT